MSQKKKFIASFILGTRPEAIKLAPVIKKFKENKEFDVKIILSGQHDEMVSQVMNLFNIEADVNLKTLDKCNTIDELISEIIKELGRLFCLEKPDIVFVQGDTTTALSGALSAFFNKIPVAHIEAGLRTDNLFSPFPEEANRRIISQVSSFHFAPTKFALDNLINNGITKNVFNSGNTVIDSLDWVLKEKQNNILNKLNVEENKYILVTVHRRENWGSSIKNISKSILEVISKNKKLKFVFPLHKNPLVRKSFKNYLGSSKNVILIEPLPYLDFICLMKTAYLVLTDSGGIQEEAATLGKPTVILRNSTERPEVLAKGNACLVGSDPEKIIITLNSLLNDKEKYLSMSKKNKDFGDGKTSDFVVTKILDFLKNRN